MNNDLQQKYDQCKDHMHAYVLVEMEDGRKVDGIITGLDQENVYLAVPVNCDDHRHTYERPFGYGYPGYPPYPPRRFNRFTIPLIFLTTLSLLPWY